MYHEAKNCWEYSYYDTVEELPKKAKVIFPKEENKESVEMTPEEICTLDGEYWTIMHSCNYGSCDHWTSQKPSTWVNKEFNRIINYVDKDKKVIGYNRTSWSIALTKNSKYFKAEVWNS